VRGETIWKELKEYGKLEYGRDTQTWCLVIKNITTRWSSWRIWRNYRRNIWIQRRLEICNIRS